MKRKEIYGFISKFERLINHLLLFGADLTFFLYSLLCIILTQSSTLIWSFRLPYFLTAALANLSGKLIPTASAAFIRYSKDNFPSGLQMFWYTLFTAYSERGFPFSWWVFYPRYWVNFYPLINLPSECLLTKGWLGSNGFLE